MFDYVDSNKLEESLRDFFKEKTVPFMFVRSQYALAIDSEVATGMRLTVFDALQLFETFEEFEKAMQEIKDDDITYFPNNFTNKEKWRYFLERKELNNSGV